MTHIGRKKADSNELRLTHAAVADGCVAAAGIENFLLFACTLLLQPHASNATCVNQPYGGDSVKFY